ncbi:pathogenesis-related protein PR-1-like [Mangifera indica]|uniref:pathogenesis-related protein PR-1-like n=1 Tax=Mangifera indica TaxID=29780 RepID=UPI001CFAC8BC|nr:pathogenesis-related protein PR-1-like [Mangifera indica]
MPPCSTANPTSPTMASFKNSISIFIFVFLFITSSSHSAYSSGYNSVVNEYLAPQNAARAAVRMRPLQWDSKVEDYAKWYANQRKDDCALQHSNGPYGENIFWGSGDDWKPAQAVALWLSEKSSYDYSSNSCDGGSDCGHYTQIIWGRTRRIGCARVVCEDDKGVFITCNYDPPGNFIGERPY